MEYLYVEVVVQSYPALIFVNEPWLKRRQNEVRQLAKGKGSERDMGETYPIVPWS